MIKSFLIKETVETLCSRQEVWLYIQNEKLRLTKSPGLTVS